MDEEVKELKKDPSNVFIQKMLYKKWEVIIMILWVAAIMSLFLSLTGCYLTPKRKALICWAISYPLAFYVLFNAL